MLLIKKLFINVFYGKVFVVFYACFSDVFYVSEQDPMTIYPHGTWNAIQLLFTKNMMIVSLNVHF